MTQAEALTILKTGANAFLTGEPGSGKTHTINTFVEWLRACGIEPSVTAATGIAATHVGGMTLHSWSGIGVADHLSAADIDRIAGKEHVARRLHKAKVLIIDEVSMLSAATLEAADAVCREARRSALPFGGLQVIFVGDFFQLPPVSRGGKEVRFAYDSSTWRELNPLVCYLGEQHRQDDDAFLGVLSAIRTGDVGEAHYEALVARRAVRGAPPDAPKLYSHNADVDRLNAEALAELPGGVKRFRMKDSGSAQLVESLKRGCLSPDVLELKEGARVMFTKNSPQGRFVNGTLGTVVAFDAAGLPLVEVREGDTIAAEPMEWKVEENGKVRATVSQVPLRLAYAITIHKSQGMSMDAAVMDLSRAFEYGQGYVALSRVRTLAGVHLLGVNQRALEVHPEVLEKDRQFREYSNATAHAFAVMPEKEVEELQKQYVKAMGGAWMGEGKEMQSARGRAHAKSRGGRATAGVLPPRLAETLQTVRDTKSLKEAAKERGLAVSTIVSHLEELAKANILQKEDFAHLLPKRHELDEINEAFKADESGKLAPIFHALGGRHSYEIIRLARLASA